MSLRLVPELSSGIFYSQKLYWVPELCGIIGKKEADGLAELVSNPTSASHNLVCPFQRDWMIFLTEFWLTASHSSYWDLVSGFRQSKIWIKRLYLKLARLLRSLSRTKLDIMIGLLTGHV
jgi:hypothetical protein